MGDKNPKKPKKKKKIVVKIAVQPPVATETFTVNNTKK
jgi:hypothetical protein